ncbi:replication initiator protein A [Staphylococcus aureus]|nr:replication initiator protein A [Staphylococcus aureus]
MYNQKFYKLHLFLFHDTRYKDLSINAKLLYAFLNDKQTLSERYTGQSFSSFNDESGSVYCIYDNQDIATDLNISVATVIRIKKELKDIGLLDEVQQGMGLSNLLYIKTPAFEDTKYDLNKWYLLPKALFAYEYYQEIDNAAKVLYAMLHNTYVYSVKQGNYIENDRSYCVLTYKKIQAVTGLSRCKIKKMKEQLKQKYLIDFYKGGFRKGDRYHVFVPQPSNKMTVTNSNSWSHLKQPKIKVKKYSMFKTTRNKHCTLSKEAAQTLDMSKGYQKWTHGICKNELMEFAKMDSNNTDINNTNINNTDTRSDVISAKYIESMSNQTSSNHNAHSSTKEQVNHEVYLKQQEKQRYLSQFPEQIQYALAPYSLEDAKHYMNVINKTKTEANEILETTYTLDSLEMAIALTIDKVKNQMKKKHEKPRQMLGYLKAAIFDCIEETNMQEVLTGLRDKFYFTDDMLNESKQRMLNQRKERAISRKVTNIMRKQPAF